MSSDVIASLVQRGMLLKEQGRYPDAEKCFREAIGLNPEIAGLYFHLAFCLYAQDGSQAALDVVDKAIQKDPSDPDAYALKSFILCSLRRRDEALKMAEQALALNPFSSYAAVARTFVLLQLERWNEAETSARRALELDPENVTASNFLAQALRLQNKMQENAEQIAYSLSKAPDNDSTHASAGWSALQQGDRKKAEIHFLEALRLNPNNVIAREGLLESYKARSLLYRLYLSYCFRMQRLNRKIRWAVILGLVVFMNISHTVLVGPYRVFYYPVLIIYLLFCLWVHVAGGVGNLILLTDRLFRRILKPVEKAQGVLVGGSVVLGLPLLLLSLVVDQPGLFPAALTLVCIAFPLAYALDNPSASGRFVFGATAFFVLVAGGVCALGDFQPGYLETGTINNLANGIILSVVATTWLANVPSLRRA